MKEGQPPQFSFMNMEEAGFHLKWSVDSLSG